jgi:hypothetical protein
MKRENEELFVIFESDDWAIGIALTDFVVESIATQ